MKDIFLLSAYTSKLQVPTILVPLSICLGIAISFIFGSATLGWIFFGVLILDFITGILSSLKRGIPITSERMRMMYFKWVAYLVVLIMSAILACVTGQVWIHGAAYGWIILSEGVSILENCEVVMGKKIPFLKRIKKMLEAFKNSGEDQDIVS